jgi:hypothetical protein
MLPANANDLRDAIVVMQKLAKTVKDAQNPRQSIHDIMGLRPAACADTEATLRRH